MHFARVQDFGQPPQYLEGPDPPAPGPGQVRLKVLATAVHRLVQMRAAGKHYSAPTAPVDPSSDGVGIDEATGQTYYIGTFAAPALSQYVNVDRARLTELPARADPVAVAALTNPILSSWMALSDRVVDLPPDFSVLILGVTGTSGRVAVPVARHFGAGTIVGAARDEHALQGMMQSPHGSNDRNRLDSYVVLRPHVQETTLDIASLGQVDVVLDYVYGQTAATVLGALASSRETQYVNIGTLGGDETLPLNAQVLRSKMLRITGSAPGSWTLPAMGRQMAAIIQMAATLPRPADVFTRPLRDIARVWDTPDAKKKRLVLLPNEK